MEAQWKDGKWYGAVVKELKQNGFIRIIYSEYKDEEDVKLTYVRFPGEQEAQEQQMCDDQPEVDSATGDPPAPTYSVGQAVEAQWEDGKFYSATVQALNGDGSIRVVYSDFGTEEDTKPQFLRPK